MNRIRRVYKWCAFNVFCQTCVMLLAGKVACANVLSDLYAMGVTEVDNMLMLLAVSTKMTEKERDVVIPLIMRGFKVHPTLFIHLKLKFNEPKPL